MEKASKWIRNFLLGKPNKENGKLGFGSHHDLPPPNPKPKRRWSFKRSTDRETRHSFTRSVDSIDVARLGVYLSELQSRDRMAVLRVVCGDGHGAATKIQSVFRSYLARKALRALRGLVKLQAAVRGYLVRKQSRATLRCFHSLISIQSRARVHRIQMANKTHQPEFIRRRSASYRNSHKEMTDLEFYHAAKSKSSHFNFPTTVTRIEHGFTAYYSGDIPGSSREPSPARYGPVDVPDFVPHYMSNTESSRAKKTRSHSEPKQRPRHRNTDLRGPIEARLKKYGSSPMNNSADFEGRNPWFSKVYKERRLVKGAESDSKSNYSRALLLYEPHLTMY